MNDQTLESRVIRVVKGNAHKPSGSIVNAVVASFPKEDMREILKIFDKLIAASLE